jgi:hypothetical protein
VDILGRLRQEASGCASSRPRGLTRAARAVSQRRRAPHRGCSCPVPVPSVQDKAPVLGPQAPLQTQAPLAAPNPILC